MRELERKHRTARSMTLVGVAMATALVVVNTFFFDSLQRGCSTPTSACRCATTSTLTLVEPRPMGALTELEHLPGVLPRRALSATWPCGCKLRHGRREKRNVGLIGLRRRRDGLRALLDEDLNRPLELPRDGPRPLAQAWRRSC